MAKRRVMETGVLRGAKDSRIWQIEQVERDLVSVNGNVPALRTLLKSGIGVL